MRLQGSELLLKPFMLYGEERIHINLTSKVSKEKLREREQFVIFI